MKYLNYWKKRERESEDYKELLDQPSFRFQGSMKHGVGKGKKKWIGVGRPTDAKNRSFEKHQLTRDSKNISSDSQTMALGIDNFSVKKKTRQQNYSSTFEAFARKKWQAAIRKIPSKSICTFLHQWHSPSTVRGNKLR